MDHLDTRVVWAGEAESLAHGGTQVPVEHSSRSATTTSTRGSTSRSATRPATSTARNTNPTVRAFEEKVADLEGADAAIGFASGMAAISGTLFTLLTPGDRVVSVKDTYGGTNQLFIDLLPRQKVDVALCDTDDHEAVERAIAAGCDVLYLETPTNPTLKVVDIEPLTRAPRTRRARSSSSTTPSRRRSTSSRSRSAPTWSCTAPPSSWAATPTRSAARWPAAATWSSASTTTARSPAPRCRRMTPTCCCAA